MSDMAIAAQRAETTGYLRGVALVLAAGLLWSSAGLGVRMLEGTGDWHIILYRSPFCMAVVALIMWGRYRSWRNIAGQFLRAGWPAVLGGICLAGSSITYIFALGHTTVATTLLVLSTAPFFAALLALLILGEAVRPVTWATMALAMIGVGVMIGGGLEGGAFLGGVFALLAALGFAGFSVSLRANKKVDLLVPLFFSALISLIVSGSMISLGELPFAVSARDLAICAFLGIFQLSIGGVLYTKGSKYVPAAELTLLSLSEIVLGPLWVWMAFSEVPGANTLLGGGIILGAITIRACAGVRRRTPPGIR